ncbi:glucose uptake inhibitor SgrT [Shimwellia pseudoproteus]|uniref:glucose uptake inhibitor SgrT n=1 Tax=Shimwellia pseudoproteus TaxID=570012 RepID=UPI0018EACDAF|nr:glucose uptake inhibitor SgrT [Shimwellia pseudoproteus]MBJ3813465.1 glucose uptake inhibitor SgrT [Shimwellia pseudoproteus]
MKSAAMAFWQHYFVATQAVNCSWLARLSVLQRLQMLDDLMQWELNSSPDLPCGTSACPDGSPPDLDGHHV